MKQKGLSPHPIILPKIGLLTIPMEPKRENLNSIKMLIDFRLSNLYKANAS